MKLFKKYSLKLFFFTLLSIVSFLSTSSKEISIVFNFNEPSLIALKTEPKDVHCGYHNGKKLYKGSRGGCYYINSNDNKTYVDRSECTC